MGDVRQSRTHRFSVEQYYELGEIGLLDRRTELLEGIITDMEPISPWHANIGDIILSDRDAKKAFEELVARVAAKGRAAGIHLLLATQRPDRNVVTGLIKANLPLKICLKVTSTMNSQIVLDEPGTEQLLGRGDLLYNAGRGLVRAQSYFIPQPEFLKLCLPDK
jgi:hypothetical protein